MFEAAGSKWNFTICRLLILHSGTSLTHKAEEVGYNPQVILAGRRINDNMSRYAAKKTIQRLVRNRIDLNACRVAVLGLTFKENCPDIRNSKVFDLINEFKQWNIDVVVVDPWCDEGAVMAQFDFQFSALSELSDMDALVVAVAIVNSEI